jgi:hypothetical protein
VAGLGRCTLAAGHATQAEALLRQALEIFQQIGAAEATDLRGELDALTDPPLAVLRRAPSPQVGSFRVPPPHTPPISSDTRSV